MFSFLAKIYSNNGEKATFLANSIKVLMQVIGKTGRLTVMTCWSQGIFKT